MRKYLLEFTLFVTGAVVMVFELAGSRVLAPYLGTSLPVWTALIGVILGSLSLGYYFGGRLSDRRLSYNLLSAIIFAGALLIALTATGKDVLLTSLNENIFNTSRASIVAALVLFAPAGIFLGMVSPYAVRLKLKALEKSGSIVGRLYAVSTVGSIAGTFAAGFWLIPSFGTTGILYASALVLAVTALIITDWRLAVVKLAVVIALAAVFGGADILLGAFRSGLADIDTKYSRYWIYKRDYGGRPVRILKTDPFGTQAAVFINEPDELVFDYLKFFRLADHFRPAPAQALLIGGGAFTFPRDFMHRYPDAAIDVVEIDDELPNIARQYFFYRDEPGISIVNEDGRTFLNRNEKKYDHIYVDAFNSHITIPFHLTTRETADRIYNSLTEDGVVIVNIISALTGNQSKFLRAELATYQTVFPRVLIFSVQNGTRAEDRQNLVLVASRSQEPFAPENGNPEIDGYLKNIRNETIASDLPVLTDDYAPVDHYTQDLIY